MNTYKQLIYGLCLTAAAITTGCGKRAGDYTIEAVRGTQHVRVWSGRGGKGIALKDTVSRGAIAGEFHGNDMTQMLMSNVRAGTPLEKYANPDSLRNIYKEITPK